MKPQPEESRRKKEVKELTTRSGISKPAESDPYSKDICKRSIPLISPEMVDSSSQVLATRVLEFGISRKELVYLI